MKYDLPEARPIDAGVFTDAQMDAELEKGAYLLKVYAVEHDTTVAAMIVESVERLKKEQGK